MAGPVDLKDFVEGFLAEADEHLSSANSNLLAAEEALRKGQPHPRAVRELFRSLHTIKGLAAMVGVEPVVDLAHEMEGVLREADRSGGRLSFEALELLLEGVRAVEQRVRALARREPVPPAPSRLVDALAGLLEGAVAPVLPPRPARVQLPAELEGKLSASEREQLTQALREGRRAVRVDFVPAPDKAARGLTITRVREVLGRMGELVKVFPRAAPGTPGGLAFVLLLITAETDAAVAAAVDGAPESVQPLQLEQAPTEAAPPPAAAVPPPAAEVPFAATELGEEPQAAHLHRYVRVEVSRLDEALERLSALVVTRFRLSRALADLAARGVDTRELGAILAENARQLRDLRAAIMHARMVSLAEVFQRVPLLLRGLTRATGKAVRLDMQTGRAELDKAVAERLFPAVVHLLRNAVDHAIETPEERRRLGKPEEGQLTLTCDERSGTHLVVTLTDDGRGIDREAVARRAGRPVPTTDEALLELICQPGLSTREQADHTSGRGMGMDIVKRTVEQLGGTMAVHTRPAAGTRFVLRVPLSITIVDTFSFTAGSEVFVVPVSMVEEIIDVDPARLLGVPAPGSAAQQTHLLERRGEPVPLLALEALFALPGARSALPPKALVVRRNGAPLAFGVDRLLGQQEVVVRPLEDPLVRVVGVSGSTDLGDGRPTLVVDLVALGATLTPRARA